ncbi:Autophagy-related protein 16-1 [Merluccius polli]|uniref:Autophagy-related protein 16-1 n=1 Tax=Merluccius polli TaxID=89951 RepID=A0AA47MIP0_MERPO|nr:Autophagy-related protein 16-1 [Merluccius polli]
METWRCHVRAELVQRDGSQRDPYAGVFRSLSELQEQFEVRQQIWEDVQSPSLDQDGITFVDLHLWLRESEHLNKKLSQTVSDLTSVLYFKEAELHYWQSQVSRYRQEALSLARGSNTMKATLNQQEFTLERQAKELSALQKEHTRLRKGMVEAWKEKGELLQRWMEEKKEEAARVNKYNDAQERWRRLARRLKKQLRGEAVKSSEVTEVNMTNGGKEAISKLE